MDILTAVAITLPCNVCGERFAVTLRQILLSQQVLRHEGCPIPDRETECPPATFAGLLDDALLGDLQHAWQRLEEEVGAVGGRLSLADVSDQRGALDNAHSQRRAGQGSTEAADETRLRGAPRTTHYALSLNFEGSVSLENGAQDCRLLNLDGSGGPPESTDQWQMTLSGAWPHQPEDPALTAELEIRGPMTGALHASLRRSGMETLTNQAGQGEACSVDLDFTVDDSSGWLTGSQGSVRLYGTVLPQGFWCTADLELDAPVGAWLPPNSGLLSAAEAASGASHAGPEPLSQKQAEADAGVQLRSSTVRQARETGEGPAASEPAGRGSQTRGEGTMAEHPQEGHTPPGVTTGSPERPAQQLAASEMSFDLAAELEVIQRERSWLEGGRDAKTLLKEADLRVVLVALKAGTRMAQHETEARVTIHAVRGHLQLHLPSGVVDLPDGHLLALDRGVSHEVEAVQDSAFVLTLALPAESKVGP